MSLSHELIYAGIGSRKAPPAVLARMRDLAIRLAKRGYKLRSGGATGSDSAFEEGCLSVKGAFEYWRPEGVACRNADIALYPTAAHELVAASIHPAWPNLTPIDRAYHSRNIGQVVGMDLETPVSFVLCWTQDGCESIDTRTRDTGGTATAIALASTMGIPVFNLANPDAVDRLLLHILKDCRQFHVDGSTPGPNEVFVFGSNLAGRHGKGSALVAKEQFGAIYGQGTGRQGQCYAVPTKDGRPGTPKLSDPAATLPLKTIAKSIDGFIAYAKEHPAENFFVVRLGCDLANHADADVAPLFAKAPSNCSFPETWRPWLGRKAPVPPAEIPPIRIVHVKERPFDVYIGRKNGNLPESIWHNPWIIGTHGTREEVVALYYDYVQTQPHLMARLGELRGKTIGCWCKKEGEPDTLCHGDPLAALVEGRPWSLPKAKQTSLF